MKRLRRMADNACHQQLEGGRCGSVEAQHDRILLLEAILCRLQNRGLAKTARTNEKQLVAVANRAFDMRELAFAIHELAYAQLSAEIEGILHGID